MAVGDVLAVFMPADNEPPAASYATLDYRNQHPTLDFDAAADESAVFSSVMPRHYANGSINVNIFWAATSATSGTTRWQVAFELMTGLDLDADSFATALSGGSTCSATNGVAVTTTITLTRAQAASVTAGSPFRLKLTRDADATTGTDDMAGDAELIVCELVEA